MSAPCLIIPLDTAFARYCQGLNEISAKYRQTPYSRSDLLAAWNFKRQGEQNSLDFNHVT